ncbi:MAG: calcium/sodium antiporter [Sedimentisphaerales bacterium]|nr:calcium/sodium antiporter [Sedimentisphaerales bacterium]
MNMILAVILLALGLLILWKCAELLVAGAVGLAERLGISPLIVGLTVVAMGTSAPEAAASIAAVLKEAGGDLAIGNVYGSNIANLALVGGLIAMINPLQVRKLTLQREIPVMFAAELLLLPLLITGRLSRSNAIVLLAVFTGLIALTAYSASKQGASRSQLEAVEAAKPKTHSMLACLILILIGLVGLAAGAKMTVEGAVFIGRRAGLSEAVIGLTIIAFGTSLPELVTCVVAALKGHHDISVGNLVGSNIFNALLVVGAAGVVSPFDVSNRFAGGVDFWIMILVSVAFTLAIILGRRIVSRLSGAILFCSYLAYLAYLFIIAKAA